MRLILKADSMLPSFGFCRKFAYPVRVSCLHLPSAGSEIHDGMSASPPPEEYK